jgi:hypothetical protein
MALDPCASGLHPDYGRATAVSVLSVYFPCGGWRAPDSWAEPFLAGLNDRLIRVQLSCDLAEADIEIVDSSSCIEAALGPQVRVF